LPVGGRDCRWPFGAVIRRGTARHPSRASQRDRAHGVRWSPLGRSVFRSL